VILAWLFIAGFAAWYEKVGDCDDIAVVARTNKTERRETALHLTLKKQTVM